MEYFDFTAKTVEEALEQGRTSHGEAIRIVDTKVLEEPRSGILGIGRKPAVVRFFYEAIEEEPMATEDESLINKTSIEDTKDQLAVTDEVLVDTVEKTSVEPEEVHPTPEERAIIADKGKQFLSDMFASMGLRVMIERLTVDDKLTFQVHGDNLGLLIGKHGQTLDAIQYLTNLVANKGLSYRVQIVVDVEGYRSRRRDTLISLAHRLAHKVEKTHHKVVLEPMNGYERKIIHLALQEEPHIVTDSEGDGPYRHVVISYKE